MDERALLPWWRRAVALCAVFAARLLVRLPPGRLRRVLTRVCRGARPAGAESAARAREAVVAVSLRCAGPYCLQRSVATALLCRLSGQWPDWCTGVRTEPFRAHAWVEAEGVPVGEDAAGLRGFRVLLRVSASGRRAG
nr:lasso peptide biosynthesis B2 protein [Streptomyces sp. SID5468]